jgi:hypothetical protein
VKRSRQALTALAIAGVAAALCAVLITILASRDSGDVNPASGPGTLEPDRGARHLGADAPATPASAPNDPPTSGPHRPVAVKRDATALSDDELLEALHQGNVVLAYGTERAPAPLKTLQHDVAGAFDPALAAAGQAVILDHRPGIQGVIALAWRRELRTADAGDPQLRAFADAWLGQGAQ